MKKLGISFSYGGGYVGYYYGVYEYLYETFDLESVSYFAGVSAGSQVAFWLACGVSPTNAWRKWFIPTFIRGCANANAFGSPYYPDLRKTAIRRLKRMFTPSMLDMCNRKLFMF